MEKSKQIIRKIKTPKLPAVATRSNLPVSLRTPKDEKYYGIAKKKGQTRPLLEEPRLKEWELWALIENEFPYSGAFKIHHMLIPKRVASREELNYKELAELNDIIDQLSEVYDCFLLNFPKKQSIKNHFHMHFLVYKDNRKEMKV